MSIKVILTVKESQKKENSGNYWYYTSRGVVEVPTNMAEIHASKIDDIINLKLKEYQFDEVTIIFNNREESKNETTN